MRFSCQLQYQKVSKYGLYDLAPLHEIFSFEGTEGSSSFTTYKHEALIHNI
jgi:hypothetical protein